MIHDGILHSVTWDENLRYSPKATGLSGGIAGDMENPKSQFSHLNDLFTLMDSLKVEKVTLMGCSSGGILAIDYVLEYPQKVTSLALVGPIVSGLGFTKHFRTRSEKDQPKYGAPVAEKIEY